MFRITIRNLFAILFLINVCGANIARAAGITDGSDNANAPAGSEWPSYNKTLDGQRYSPLGQINKSNVAGLKEVCRVQVTSGGSFQAGLIVIDGVMYATTADDTLALNPADCKILWRHRHRRDDAAPFPVNRGVAYYGGRLFRGTVDGRVIALDARTGTELWANVVGLPSDGEIVTGAPIAWNGLVIVGTAASEFGVRGRVIAYDAMSGREVWRFNTVPAPGEPNHDTWGGSVWATLVGGGGGTWSHFALDPSTSEVFIPVGNPIPDFVPAERPGDNLYTNSVLVLDALTGKLRWWYQLKPADGHDHDLAAAPILFRDSEGTSRVAAAGKDGYLHVIDRSSRKRVSRTAVTRVDDPQPLPTPEGVKSCPGPAGGVEWNGPGFDPGRHRLYVGSLDYCALFQSEPDSRPEAGGYNMGGVWTGIGTPRGWLYALDADTGAVAWRYHADHPMLSAVTPTAGGIVFAGNNAGELFAFDSDTGEVLHSVDTGGSLSGGVITYQHGTRQYVAVTSGNVSRSVFGAVGRPHIVVMALPHDVLATAASATSRMMVRGQAQYFSRCAVCHGADGKAWSPVDIQSVKSKMKLDELITFIKNPRAPMPRVFPQPISADDEQDAEAIARFIMQWE